MKKFIIILVIVLIAAFFISRRSSQSSPTAEPPKPPKIEGAPETVSPPKFATPLTSPEPEPPPPPLPSERQEEASQAESESIEPPPPIPADSETLRSDTALTNLLSMKLANDSRIQGAANIRTVVCDSGTCLITAQAKPNMQSELETAFSLFQKDYPEFGSKFKMDINPDADGLSTFVYAQ